MKCVMFFNVKCEYTLNKSEASEAVIMWVNVWEIKRIHHKAELVRGDSSSEWTDPLQDSSVSGNDMNTIDLGSAVGATLYIKPDKGSTASSSEGRSLLSAPDVRKKKKGNAMLDWRQRCYHCGHFPLRRKLCLKA